MGLGVGKALYFPSASYTQLCEGSHSHEVCVFSSEPFRPSLKDLENHSIWSDPGKKLQFWRAPDVNLQNEEVFLCFVGFGGFFFFACLLDSSFFSKSRWLTQGLFSPSLQAEQSLWWFACFKRSPLILPLGLFYHLSLFHVSIFCSN